MSDLGEHTDHLEVEVSKYATAYNNLVDAFTDHQTILHTKIKLLILEHRSRRNNITFKGILELVNPSELHNYLHHMLKFLIAYLPYLGASDSAHRLYKRKHSYFPHKCQEMSSPDSNVSMLKNNSWASMASLPEPHTSQCTLISWQRPPRGERTLF